MQFLYSNAVAFILMGWGVPKIKNEGLIFLSKRQKRAIHIQYISWVIAYKTDLALSTVTLSSSGTKRLQMQDTRKQV